jgi:hypothetical protein
MLNTGGFCDEGQYCFSCVAGDWKGSEGEGKRENERKRVRERERERKE